MKDELVVVAEFHALFDFPEHFLDSIGLAYPHDRPPDAGIARGRLGLGDEKDRMAHISSGELPPVSMKWNALTQGDSPVFTIRRHDPLLGQLGNVCPGVAVNTYEVFERWPLVE